MTVLIDIAHPAHVHFYKHVVRALEARGTGVVIAARDKDVTCQLLEAYGFRYRRIGKSGKKSLLGQAAELLHRDSVLARIAREHRVRLILTRNPAGAQVGRMLGIKTVFDTDDGPAAGLHYYSAAPFAHVITTPDCTRQRLGPKHLKYPGYKQTAYLHPNHFRPNPEVLEHLGVAAGERYFVARFVDMVASHDAGESGLSLETKLELIERLSESGKLFISSEGSLPASLEGYRFRPPAHLLHDALAFASLLVGDSQTMAAEAAVLGTPSLRVSSWKGRLDYLDELELRYGLTESFHPHERAGLFERVRHYLDQENPRALIAEQHRAMLDTKCDVAEWYTNYAIASL